MRCINKYKKEAEAICKHFIGDLDETFIQSLNEGYFRDFVVEAIQMSITGEKVLKNAYLGAYFKDIETRNNTTDAEAQAKGVELVVTDDLVLIPTGNMSSYKIGEIGDMTARYWINGNITVNSVQNAIDILSKINADVTNVDNTFIVKHSNNAKSIIAVGNSISTIEVSKIKC